MFLNPDNILDQLNLRVDTMAADFGCGSGGFTIPLAEKLTDGSVYALDILEQPLNALKNECQIANITNVRIIRCDLEEPRGSTLGDVSVNLVVIANTLFQLEEKEKVISEAKRILTNGGKLLIIDWLDNAPQGPQEARISPDEVKKMAESADFKLLRELEAGKYHYGLLFSKP